MTSPALTASTVELALPSIEGVEEISDEVLASLLTDWSEVRRVVDAGIARLAGEVARRSSLAAGYAGLAQRTGDRTPDALVSRLTGTSGSEARDLVRVGTMLAEPSPWLTPVVDRVASGELSIGAAAAIERRLGTPDDKVAADDLLDAAALLVDEVGSLAPEKVARLAGRLRDRLDVDGVADREQVLRDKRWLRLVPEADGMTRITGRLDPETAATWKAALDPLTSPRRGGPRFVDSADLARAEAIQKDPRTLDQLTVDAVTELLRIGTRADDGRLYGSKKPSVRIQVTASDLESGAGFAWIESESAQVSLSTAQRLACADGYRTLYFDRNGDGVDLGRTQRLFSDKQRELLAAIWGGCAVDGCDRPPSWCEAHHLDHWNLGGRTDLKRGILLCRHHHLLLHNNAWRIDERSDGWWFAPPPGDSLARPIRLLSKNPLRRAPRPSAPVRAPGG